MRFWSGTKPIWSGTERCHGKVWSILIKRFFFHKTFQTFIIHTAGRHLAKEVACKFIETSSGLDHHVNELLVGIVAQVKLNPQRIRNLSEKQKLQLASANNTICSTTVASKASSALQKQKTTGAVAAVIMTTDDDDDYGAGCDAGAVATVVETHPLPRTARENQLFTAGGRPYGQRVVLRIKQPNKQSSGTDATGPAELASSADDRRRRREVSPSPSSSSSAAADAENRSPRRSRDPATSYSEVSGSGSSGSASGGVAEKPSVSGNSGSPVSRISLRTKYLLTSFLKFRRTLRAKRRNSSSCSDLFVI